MRPIRSERELVSFLKAMREQAEDPTAAAPPPAPDVAVPTAPAATERPPITVEEIIEKLNIVRSGRSTKDSDVKRELEEYVGQFSEEEKQALVAFLEGLGQILTSGVDSEDAVDPRDPYALQIQRSAGASPGKALKTPQAAATPPAAPTPGPVPIKVGG
jgi:hypothetical protein